MMKKIAKQVLRLFAPKLDEKIERLKRDVIEHIFSKSKRMKALFNYVHEENDADKRINELETEHSVTKAKLEHAILEITSIKQKLNE